MAIKAQPPYYPADEAAVVTPSDVNDLRVSIPGFPESGGKLHNRGLGGVVSVDLIKTGTQIQIYMGQGDYCPLLVKKVWAAGLGAGVDLIVVW